jgi:hypothetical protein
VKVFLEDIGVRPTVLFRCAPSTNNRAVVKHAPLTLPVFSGQPGAGLLNTICERQVLDLRQPVQVHQRFGSWRGGQQGFHSERFTTPSARGM